MASIASAALPKLSEFDVAHLAKLSWASAPLKLYIPKPYSYGMLEESEGRILEMNAASFHAMLWATWQNSSPFYF